MTLSNSRPLPSKGSGSDNETTSTRSGTSDHLIVKGRLPWWRTRKGTTLIVVAVVLAIGAVIGGAIGATAGRRKAVVNFGAGVSTGNRASEVPSPP